MKRARIWLAVVMAAVLCLQMAGCTGGDSAEGSLYDRINEREGRAGDVTGPEDVIEPEASPSPTEAPVVTVTPVPTEEPTLTPDPTEAPPVNPALAAYVGKYKYVADKFVGDGEFNFTDTAGELSLREDGTGSVVIGGAQWLVKSWEPEGEDIILKIDGKDYRAQAEDGIIWFEFEYNIRYFADETADLSKLGEGQTADIDEELVGRYALIGGDIEDGADMTPTFLAIINLIGMDMIELELKADGTAVLDYGPDTIFPTWKSASIDFGYGDTPIERDGNRITFSMNGTKMIFKKSGVDDVVEYKWSDIEKSSLIRDTKGKIVKVKEAGIKLYVPEDYAESKITEKEAANNVIKKYMMKDMTYGKCYIRIKDMKNSHPSLESFREESIKQEGAEHVRRIDINGNEWIYVDHTSDKKISFTTVRRDGGITQVVYAPTEDQQVSSVYHVLAASLDILK